MSSLYADGELNTLQSLYEGKSNSVAVRVASKWVEYDFMCTSKVKSVDMVIVDQKGDELHVTIPDKLIWNFDNKVKEHALYSVEGLQLTNAKAKFRPVHGESRVFFRCNTFITPLSVQPDISVSRKFNFTEFEHIESNIRNIQLTDVVGYLRTFTDVQVFRKAGERDCRMRKISIENLRGSILNVALWGSAANQVCNRPDDAGLGSRPVLVAVCSTAVKNYQGAITLSSTNANKVHHNLDVPYVVQMQQRCSYFNPSRHVTVPVKGVRYQTSTPEHVSRSTHPATIASGWSMGGPSSFRTSKFSMFRRDMMRNLNARIFRAAGREILRVIMYM